MKEITATCSKCGEVIEQEHEDHTIGFAYDLNGNKICYCGQMDIENNKTEITMTNAEKIAEIQKIEIVTFDDCTYQPDVDKATKEIENLQRRKVELEELHNAATWLHENGYTIGTGYCNDTVTIKTKKLAHVINGHRSDSDTYVEKLPVTVTDGGAVFTKQLEIWEKMTEPERILFILSQRPKKQKKEIEKAEVWLAWLNAEFE